MSASPLSYSESGVVAAGKPLAGLIGWANRTLAFREGRAGESLLGIGFYANVLRLTETLGLALSTDGVGTKILVAEMLRKYDTLGIDCIAMNANDILCVGAEPLAMVDYLAVQETRPEVLEEIGRGLYEGARQANISIPGGELAQVREMLAGVHPGEGIDLVGACVGLVQLDRMVLGDKMEPGDVVIGLAASGLHSNGYTLARRALLEAGGLKLEQHVEELGRTLGEELLEPTRIYVKPVWQMLAEGLPVHGLYHITGDGLLNLARGERPLGFDLEWLPEPPPVFQLIARCGGVAAAEMYYVFNMGIGFCVVAPESAAARIKAIAGEHGVAAWELGRVVRDDRKRVWLREPGLVGEGDAFHALT
ncbi:MAG TPA: phosphoribosylformylglycinamidine cyclo-ligase [Armatimonadota bacterium]|nr:phosphoribosylformylglycinamidine cyclo-ligase [Armatimonadota bacterium]